MFNGLQLGMLLFLVAAGLTLVFGVMDFINLAHGVQYMLGAYLAVTFYRLTGSFFAACCWRCRPRCCSGCCWRCWYSAISTSATTWSRCWRPSASSCS